MTRAFENDPSQKENFEQDQKLNSEEQNVSKMDLRKKKHSLLLFLLILVIASVAYRLLVKGKLEQTSALFIGLPALLSMLLVYSPESKTTGGNIFKGITFFLLISSIFLGEGFICILMASPLFYMVGLLVAQIANRSKRILPITVFPLLLLMSLEGTTNVLSFERKEEVRVETTLPWSLQKIRNQFASPMQFSHKNLPFFLKLKFPLPQQTWGQGLEVGHFRKILFAGGEGKPGILALEITYSSARKIILQATQDKSHISHWLKWKTIEIEFVPLGKHSTQIIWKQRYDRLLDPAWYFGPIERYAVRKMSEYLIASLLVPQGPQK